jgi:hypothetical protein
MKFRFSVLLTAVVLSFGAASFASPANAATRAEAEAACTPDALKFCSQQIPDEKKVRSCLIKNRKQLTTACAEIFKGGKRRTKKKRRA